MCRADDRHIPAVISRRFFLLVRGVVLFVDDDETKAVERCKDRRAGTHHDVHVSASDAMPLIVTLAVGQRAVLNRHAFAECGTEQRRDRRSERDLRDHEQHLPAPPTDVLRQPQIDLGLAAASDAVQERGAEFARVGERDQSIEGRALLVGEHAGRVEGLTRGLTPHRGAFEWIAVLGLGSDRHQPFRHQSVQQVRRHTALAQFTERKTCPRRGKDLERLPLFWGQSWWGQGWGLAQGLARNLVRNLALSPLEAMGGNRRDTAGPEGRRTGASTRGQSHRDRIADSSQVVLRHPRAQIDDPRRQKRLPIDDLDDVLDRVGCGSVGLERDDATGQRARADRHTNAGADGRKLEMIRNGVGEAIEKRNRDRY